ncbi:hypothetical protein HRG_009475 [Hirsutella rhossiliensis]|uniref:Uncharacterized protein n=1 Tax=Hirsutella rhossiliensis TaxID=111463 RepID=A0A9P8MQ45_9HYPO|nr:uncharacterized protein HRG_09475 [Hirsutella rhossiliensis]KAH0959693.1 hypothetical protein HRG_09475 [Hirsutella rhossiliensis]
MGHMDSPGPPRAGPLYDKEPAFPPSRSLASATSTESGTVSVSGNEKPCPLKSRSEFSRDRPAEDEEAGEPRSVGASSGKEPICSPDGKRIMTEDDCYDTLGYSWPAWKKWMLLSSIFAVQVSMNFNTNVYPSVVTPLSEHFGVSEQAAQFGRWPILQSSLFLVNIWQILAALAPDFGSIIRCTSSGTFSLWRVFEKAPPNPTSWY